MLRDFLGTEHRNIALAWGMFFLNIFSCYLTNFDETKRRTCVIVQASHGGPKSRETRNSFWEHQNTVLFSISNVFRSCLSQCPQKLYSKILKTYIKGFFWFWYAMSGFYNYTFSALFLVKLVTRKILRGNIPQSGAKFVCSLPKKPRGIANLPHCKKHVIIWS